MDFYEDDEPVEKVADAFKRGEKKRTRPSWKFRLLRALDKVILRRLLLWVLRVRRPVTDRLDAEIVELNAAAGFIADADLDAELDITEEEFDRRWARGIPVEVVGLQPSRFRCDHFDVSIGGAGRWASRPEPGCGCTMRPVLEATYA